MVLFVCAGLFAQERIAVFPFEVLDNAITRNESVMLYREFSNKFTNMGAGRFYVVPRQEVDRLINAEAMFQLSDFSSRVKTAEMERVLNGTQILSGLIGKLGNSINITVSLYTYPELVQQPGGASIRVANITELFDKIPELVQSMRNEIVGKETNRSYDVNEYNQYDWEFALAKQVKRVSIYNNSTEVLVYHSVIPIGTYITLTNLNNNRNIFAKIIGNINGRPDHLYISEGVAQLLGIYDPDTPIKIELEGR